MHLVGARLDCTGRAEELGGLKSTKGRHDRYVPVANRVLPIIRRLPVSRPPGALLLTTVGGSKLHRSSVLRTVKWTRTGQGRRIHDLRHTAACLWLARGVDPGTVQAWMGHESIATTNRYLHFLGTSADRAGLDRVNDASRHAESRPGDGNEGRAEGRGYARERNRRVTALAPAGSLAPRQARSSRPEMTCCCLCGWWS